MSDASQKNPPIPIPLIVHIYGGPAGQTVQNSWGGTNGLFHQMLAKEGYAIFSVDNRRHSESRQEIFGCDPPAIMAASN